MEMEEEKIPQAVFIENIEQWLKSNDPKQLQEQYQRYKYMEIHLSRCRESLESKIPDLHKTMDVLQNLKVQQFPFTTDFMLSESTYAKAEIPELRICLWLGANVLCEFPISEAEALIQDNILNANRALTSAKKDMEFVREQMTTTEVNIARIHNHNVKIRQQQIKS